MSIPRETQRIDDEIVGLLSRWPNLTLGNDELRTRIETVVRDTAESTAYGA